MEKQTERQRAIEDVTQGKAGGPVEREILNVRQAAQYLGISPDTMYLYATLKGIPGFKLGNRWRFRRSDIQRWMDEEIKKRAAIPSKTR